MADTTQASSTLYVPFFRAIPQAQLMIFFGDFDRIAPVATTFFLISYSSINLSCFLLSISGTPNFRPVARSSWQV